MASDVTSTLSGIFSGTLGVLVVIGLIILGMGLVGGIIWYFFIHKRNFNVIVKIYSVRAGDPRVIFDKGAILIDKSSQGSYLKLLNLRHEIEMPKFDVLFHTNAGDYVELYRISERDFKFLTPPKVDKEFIVLRNGKLYPIARMKQKMIENDISWIIERLRKNSKIIDPQKLLGILLQNLPQIISGVVSIFVLWIVVRYIPGLLGSVEEFYKRTLESQTPTIVGSSILAFFKWKEKL